MRLMPNVVVSATFLDFVISRLHIIGIGKAMTERSMTTLIMLVVRSCPVFEPQWSSRSGFQILAKGLHIKNIDRTMLAPNMSTRPITQNAILQNRRFGRNSVT